MHPDDQQLYRLLEDRVGSVHLRQRLGIESDREALVFGQGRTFFHIENWYGLTVVIRAVFHLTLLHARARRNALDIELRHNTIHVPELPPAVHGFTILHISDLHLDMNGDLPHVLAERVMELDYDICVLTGDYRYRTSGPFEAALAGMERVRLHLRDPVYGVLGNHDSIRMVPRLEAMGIHMLINESVTLEYKGHVIFIAGIDDPHYYRAENFDRACRHLTHDAVSILLAHSPEVYKHAAHTGFNIMLCGHTHGGQLCLPGGKPILVDADCPRKYCVRAWQYHELQGYTSVGAGSSLVDLRFNNRPEITLHRLHGADSNKGACEP
jgi:predicted MPP superfamily phosphohydrolase